MKSTDQEVRRVRDANIAEVETRSRHRRIFPTSVRERFGEIGDGVPHRRFMSIRVQQGSLPLHEMHRKFRAKQSRNDHVTEMGPDDTVTTPETEVNYYVVARPSLGHVGLRELLRSVWKISAQLKILAGRFMDVLIEKGKTPQPRRERAERSGAITKKAHATMCWNAKGRQRSPTRSSRGRRRQRITAAIYGEKRREPTASHRGWRSDPIEYDTTTSKAIKSKTITPSASG